MKLKTTYRPFQTWKTETLKEELKELLEWRTLVPHNTTIHHLHKERNISRMQHELKLRG